MNVAFLISTFPKLSETFLLNQIVGLLDAGHDVTIFAHRQPDMDKRHDVVDEYRLLERTVYTDAPESYGEAAMLTLRTLASHPLSAGEVFRSLARGKEGGKRLGNVATFLDRDFDRFDVIHGHFGTTCKAFDFLASSPSSRLEADLPFVASFYGYDVSKALKDDPDAYAGLFPHCSAVTALSEDMRTKLADAGCEKAKITKQQLAIDTDRIEYRGRSRSDDEPIRLVTVARFTEKKGLEYALDAVAQVAGEYDVSYRIAGDGPLRNRIERKIERRGLEEEVELLGWIDQEAVNREFERAHAFLLPSVTAENGDEEGTPTVLLEAQAAGMPVVSTYHAGIPEIVADGESGVLVPPRDADALADGLRELLESPDEWSKMGKAGRELVESNHSIPAMVDRLERLYGEAIEKAG